MLKGLISGTNDRCDSLAIMEEAGLESWFSAIQVQDFSLFICHALSERISGNLEGPYIKEMLNNKKVHN